MFEFSTVLISLVFAGCAFVEYAEFAKAQKAISKLHEQLVLDSEAGPIQIRYADKELKRLGNDCVLRVSLF